MLEQIRFSTMKHQEVCLNAYHISVKKMCASCQFKARHRKQGNRDTLKIKD